MAHLLWDGEKEEFDEAYKHIITNPNIKAIKEFSWENGGVGCNCLFASEGLKLASDLAAYYHDHIRWWAEEALQADDCEDDCYDEDSEEEERDDKLEEDPIVQEKLAEYDAIIENAKTHYDDYDAVQKALQMVSRILDMVS